MPTLKEIEQNLETISTIKNIVQVYQEIADMRMRTIRERVLKNRKFFIELSKVYQRTKMACPPVLKKNWTKKKEISLLRPSKKRVAIFLSANNFFYGALILNIWQKIQNYSKKNSFDLVVTGKVGKYLAKEDNFGAKLFYFELNDENPETENIKKIIEFIKDYKEILVFHGRYETVLDQAVVMSEISGGLPTPKDTGEIKTYLFEPSSEAVLKFFEREIIVALFNQTILEHQLARYASRIIAMYQATENAKNSKKNLKITEAKLQRQKINKKQIELFSNF